MQAEDRIQVKIGIDREVLKHKRVSLYILCVKYPGLRLGILHDGPGGGGGVGGVGV